MLDSDLAKVYGVTTGQLNQAVSRNADRFPRDFMFELALEEFRSLLSQIVIAKKSRGGRHNLPKVFTEHGAVMLASVLRSPQAAHASIAIARAFVRLREWALTHKDLARKIEELEHRVGSQDQRIESVFDALRKLVKPEKEPRPEIGFKPNY